MKTPQQKKEESYAHDRPDSGEYPHAARKNRPRVKALGQRAFRRVAKQQLASEPEEILQLPEDRTRATWVKNGVRLRKLVEETQESRIARSAHNIFKHGYSPVTHARFRRRVLRSWMKGQSEQSLAPAKFYWGVLRGVPDEQTTRLRSYGPDNRG